MAYVRCDGCDGRKLVVGLGGMKRDCPTCKGVGFTSDVAPETNVVVKRKRRTPDEMLADADKGE